VDLQIYSFLAIQLNPAWFLHDDQHSDLKQKKPGIQNTIKQLTEEGGIVIETW